ncbi:MAG TPA: plasmid partitioning protein RepB [Rhabdaerophilum sp.]|nr:plasmid partitioning protein RepB [Rhabdaerophilum sp.]
MSRKSTIDALFGNRPSESLGAPNNPDRPSASAVRTGAVAAMGASLQQWTAAQKTSEELQAQIASAQTVVELDPATIDPAPVRDRIAIENDPSFDALVESLRQSGQQVPILVRPSPTMPGRYQTAYGHRRVQAARTLGFRVRAVVAELSDEALVTAQGKENGERRDLSFIEKALFAKRLDDAKYDRSLICSALSIDKADLSRAISVVRAVPETLIQSIGPAPKAGRARWLALAEAVSRPKAMRRVETLLGSDSFRLFQSDQRFAAVLKALEPSSEKFQRPLSVLSSPTGQVVIYTSLSTQGHVWRFNERQAPGFAEFLSTRLPDLLAQFERDGSGG